MTVEAQVVFLHVPKTAGTTVRGIAFAHYGEARVAPIYPGEPVYLGVEEFAGLTAEQRGRADFVIGHVAFGFHNYLGGRRRFRYATILRDPIRRCVSLYDHMVARQFSGTAQALTALLQGPEGFQFDNHQTRLVSGMHAPLGQCPRAMLDRAKENIEREFTFVGVTELFDESLLLAESVLGWPLRPYAMRNITAHNPGWRSHRIADDVGNGNLARLEAMNTLDRELYDFARARLLAQLRAAVPEWEGRVAVFRQQLQDAPVPAPDSMGALAPLQAGRIFGWSKLVGHDVPTHVRIEIAGREPLLAEASQKRKDLRVAGVHFAAACGFALDLPTGAGLRHGDTVRAFNADTGKELANSPRVFDREGGT